MITVRRFLNEISKKLRDGLPISLKELPVYNFSIENESIPDGNLISVWFRTRGCFYHKIGNCTMCSYDDGLSPHITDKQIINNIDYAFNELKLGKNTTLLFSPTGSLLDDREVSLSVREHLLKKVASIPIIEFGFETRIETITSFKLMHLKQCLKNVKISLETGIESTSHVVSSCSINKPFSKKLFKHKISLVKKSNLNVLTNLFFGSPFLTHKEMVFDVVHSAKWLLNNKVDKVIILPVQVKDSTLLYWLYSNGLYEPPPLWGLVDIIIMLSENYLKSFSISLYKNPYIKLENSGFNEFEKATIRKPTFSCPNCYPELIRLLDDFKRTESIRTVKQLKKINCSCRIAWNKTRNQSKMLGNKEKHSYYLKSYKKISTSIWDNEYWEDIYPNISKNLWEIIKNEKLKSGI